MPLLEFSQLAKLVVLIDVARLNKSQRVYNKRMITEVNIFKVSLKFVSGDKCQS